MNIKIYEGKLIDCIKNCLKDGRFPATVEQIKELKKKGLIDKNKWYDTSTISYKGEKKTANLKELQNIEEVWKKGGRLWSVNLRGGVSLAGGYYYLSYALGCLVGVAADPQKEEGYIENKEVTRFKPVTTKRPGFEFPKKKHKGKCCQCVGDGK